MIGIQDIPALNATLNGTSALLLLGGLVAIKRKNVALHRKCMVAAFSVSSLFLVGYLLHKVLAGHTAFQGTGGVRAVYFIILGTHTLLAAATVPLAIVTLRRGLRGDLVRHRRLARITWPVWFYVSVTGVVIWWMLYSGTFGPKPA